MKPDTPSDKWFLYINEQNTGPYSLEQVREFLASGIVNDSTYLCRQGDAHWVMVKDIPELCPGTVQNQPQKPIRRFFSLRYLIIAGISLCLVIAAITSYLFSSRRQLEKTKDEIKAFKAVYKDKYPHQMMSDEDPPFALMPRSHDGKYGYINQYEDSKPFVITPRYDNAWPFIKDYAVAMVKADGKYGLINHKAEYIIKPTFMMALTAFSEGLFCVAICDENNHPLWGFIDPTGSYVIKPQYQKAYQFLNGLAPVMVDRLWGYIDKNGKMVITPKYYQAFCFSSGMAPVQFEANGLFGYINLKEEPVIEPTFEFAASFANGRARAMQNRKWGFIDPDGNWVVNAQYDRAFDYDDHGRAMVGNGTEVIVLNLAGKIIRSN